MNQNRPIALWAVPRSISTAFERVFVERDDFEVLHEPFSNAYYYGTNRLSDRYADTGPKEEYSFDNVLADVLAPREKRVFVKDMAYQAKNVLSPEFASRFVNTFIVRDPKYVLVSLYKMWPDFTFEETGYEDLYRLFRYATEGGGQDVVVVDAMTFSENPAGVLAAYCEHLEIPFESGSLSWESRDVEHWDSWEGWHDDAEQSTGIKPATRRDPELPAELEEVYEKCLPYYYELAAHAIHATPRPGGTVSRPIEVGKVPGDGPVAPHGGRLVDRVVRAGGREERLREAAELPKVPLGPRALSNLEMISTGVFSPLTGFMDRETYESVVEDMRLPGGTAWPLPVTLTVDEERARDLPEDAEISLVDGDGEPVATMLLRERYRYDREREARLVYRTDERDHPGVAALYRRGDVSLGGEVELIRPPDPGPFPNHYYTPQELRAAFRERGWRSVVGFQTRRPIHRALEHIQKSALETVDGLLLNPIVGETGSDDDVPADVRMRSYETILQHYYPKDRTLLAVFPAAMRYAGPREAVFHALCRKNYGCTHFIVGRDHAGVGSFYGTYDAQAIFDEFEPEELGIIPLFFEHAFFCRECYGMVSSKTCPHPPSSHVFISDARLNEMLRKGEYPPPEFARAEVVEVLIDGLGH